MEEFGVRVGGVLAITSRFPSCGNAGDQGGFGEGKGNFQLPSLALISLEPSFGLFAAVINRNSLHHLLGLGLGTSPEDNLLYSTSSSNITWTHLGGGGTFAPRRSSRYQATKWTTNR